MSATLIREEFIKKISDALSEFEVKVSNQDAIHLLDVNTVSEDFVCGLMNHVYGYSLNNLNSTEKPNYPGIDLASDIDKIAVQVTADSGRDKIQQTLGKFFEHGYNVKYSRLIIFIIGKKKNFIKPFEVVESSFDFDYRRDIIDIQGLLKSIKAIKDTRKLEELSKYVLYELGKIKSQDSIDFISIEQERKTVQALCHSKMMSLDISRECVDTLIQDDIESDRFKYVIESGKPFLIGDYGTGKSHAIYILYLQQYKSFVSKGTNKIPRFTNVREIVKAGDIESWVGSEWLETHECILFLDGLDEVDYQEINRLSDEIAYFSERYKSCRLIIGSRHLSILDENKCIHIKHLDDESINRIYSVITGHNDSLSSTINLSKKKGLNYKTMLDRPFFLLLYCSLRMDQSFVFSNDIDFVQAFIDKSVKKQIDNKAFRKQMILFAAQSISENIAPIHETAIDPVIDLNELLKSGLVVRDEDGYFNFPLPVIAHWLAAMALKEGHVDIMPILNSKRLLIRWRYPISIYFGMIPFEISKEYFANMIIKYPGVSCMIIKDGIKRYHIGAIVDSFDAGEKLQYCMRTWVKSAGSLLKQIQLTTDGKEPNSLNVYVKDSWVRYSWSWKRLDYDFDVSEKLTDFINYNWEIKRSIPEQATWPWIITYEMIKDRLKKAINDRSFISRGEQTEKEFIWATALKKEKKGTLYDGEITISELMRSCPDDEMVNQLLDKDKHFYKYISNLNDKGIVSIRPPFPVGDRRDSTGLTWIWNSYSKEQMLERIKFKYNKGVSEYIKLVEKYFYEVKDELSLYAALPAKIVGQLFYDDHIDKMMRSNCPCITTCVLPLETKEKTIIDISYENEVDFYSEELRRIVRQHIHQNRLDNIDFVYSTIKTGECFDSTATPVTDWVYDHLKKDLMKICWLD